VPFLCAQQTTDPLARYLLQEGTAGVKPSTVRRFEGWLA
jgi:hypothetical protein